MCIFLEGASKLEVMILEEHLKEEGSLGEMGDERCSWQKHKNVWRIWESANSSSVHHCGWNMDWEWGGESEREMER